MFTSISAWRLTLWLELCIHLLIVYVGSILGRVTNDYATTVPLSWKPLYLTFDGLMNKVLILAIFWSVSILIGLIYIWILVWCVLTTRLRLLEGMLIGHKCGLVELELLSSLVYWLGSLLLLVWQLETEVLGTHRTSPLVQVGHALSEMSALRITSQDSRLIQLFTTVNALAFHTNWDSLILKICLGTDSPRLCGSYWPMTRVTLHL